MLKIKHLSYHQEIVGGFFFGIPCTVHLHAPMQSKLSHLLASIF